MTSRRGFLFTLAGLGTIAAIGIPSVALAASNPVSATAITRVYGDGVRFIAAALEFDRAIDGASLSAADFTVRDRTVTDVYTANSTDPADKAMNGRFVIVALSPDDAGASLLDQSKQNTGMAPPPAEGKGNTGGPRPGGPGKAGDIPVYDMYFLPAEASIEQAGAFATTEGKAVTLPETPTKAVRNLVVDDFRQQSFTDKATGCTLAYNLYVPKDYDPAKSYPLVLFMHDAGATSDVTRTTLLQGLGAISWASPEDQAKRPCFVLAPQYAEIITDDDSHTSGMLDTTIDLIKTISSTYSVDSKRLYATGQSGGCMMSIAMNIKYPDFFAASFLVAGQWDPTLVTPIAGNKLWIIVSQDDNKAFPGEIAITETLAASGARISRAVWDATWTADQYRFAFDDLDAEQSPINFISFAAGTVFPKGASTEGASGHRNTWRVAYSIEPIREWIFRHQK